MIAALTLAAALLVLVAVIVFVYLTQKSFRGFAVVLERERSSHRAEKAALIAKVQQLDADAKAARSHVDVMLDEHNTLLSNAEMAQKSESYWRTRAGG